MESTLPPIYQAHTRPAPLLSYRFELKTASEPSQHSFSVHRIISPPSTKNTSRTLILWHIIEEEIMLLCSKFDTTSLLKTYGAFLEFYSSSPEAPYGIKRECYLRQEFLPPYHQHRQHSMQEHTHQKHPQQCIVRLQYILNNQCLLLIQPQPTSSLSAYNNKPSTYLPPYPPIPLPRDSTE